MLICASCSALLIQEAQKISNSYLNSNLPPRMSLLKLRKVLVSDKIANDCLEAFKGKGVEVTYKPGLSKTELIDIIPEYNGIIVRSATKVTADVIKAAVNLEVCPYSLWK